MRRQPFPLRRMRPLECDERGVAMIEFAIVLPFMVLLYLGGYQLMDAISAYRKVGVTVRALADLTTQNTTMTSAQADEILNASRQVMAPYSPSNAALRITEIQVKNDGTGTVIWSRSLNGTALTPGSSVAISAYLAALPDNYFVLSEINYTYKPKIASSLIGTIPLSQTIYMSPRNSAFIAYSN